MNTDLRASNLSAVTLFADCDDLPNFRRVLLPANSAVRVMGVVVRIPVGEERFVGPCDLTYEVPQVGDTGPAFPPCAWRFGNHKHAVGLPTPAELAAGGDDALAAIVESWQR